MKQLLNETIFYIIMKEELGSRCMAESDRVG
jgi:hypothetical protein